MEPSKGRLNQLRRDFGQEVPKPAVSIVERLKQVLECHDVKPNVSDEIVAMMGGHPFVDYEHLSWCLRMYSIKNAWDIIDTYRNFAEKEPDGCFEFSKRGEDIIALIEKIGVKEPPPRPLPIRPSVIPAEIPDERNQFDENYTHYYRVNITTSDNTYDNKEAPAKTFTFQYNEI